MSAESTARAPLEVEMWMLCDFRGGRYSRIQYFLEREAALAAVGEDALR